MLEVTNFTEITSVTEVTSLTEVKILWGHQFTDIKSYTSQQFYKGQGHKRGHRSHKSHQVHEYLVLHRSAILQKSEKSSTHLVWWWDECFVVQGVVDNKTAHCFTCVIIKVFKQRPEMFQLQHSQYVVVVVDRDLHQSHQLLGHGACVLQAVSWKTIDYLTCNQTFIKHSISNIQTKSACTGGGNCSPGSSRLYRLNVSQAQKAKVSGDERPRFIAFAPNFLFLPTLWRPNAIQDIFTANFLWFRPRRSS